MTIQTRKDLILETIDNYTSKALIEQNFDFSSCNAHILSLDLHIDRSNISRILNQLFTKGDLIKTSSRPTLYISRKVIEENFPFVEIPSVLKKEELLQDYLYVDTQSKNDAMKNLIGAKKGGSLYNTITSLLPIFSKKTDKTFIFSLSGPLGSGKRFIAEQIFQYAKKFQKQKKEACIYYCNYNAIARNMDSVISKIDTNIHSWILMEINGTYEKSTLFAFIMDIQEHYLNTGNPLSALSIIFHNNEEKLFFLPSCYSYDFMIPPLNERSLDEVVELIIAILSKTAFTFNREIHIQKPQLNKFVQSTQKYNIEKLENEIYRSVSMCFYHSSKNARVPLLIENAHLSNDIRYMENDTNIDAFLSKLPFMLEIKPLESQQTSLRLNLENLNIKTRLDQNFSYNLEYAILKASSNFVKSESSPKRSDIGERILNILKNTALSTDFLLIEFIIEVIDKFVENRISIQKYKILHPKKVKSNIQLIIDSIFRVFSNSSMQMFHIMSSEKYILTHLINECFVMTAEVSTPLLIVTNSNHISENYANQFNLLAKRRMFFSIEFSKNADWKNLDSIKKELYSVISQLNRGKGIYMIADHKQITKLGSNMFTQTKVPVFLFTFSSLSVFLDLIKQIDTADLNSIAFSRSITKNTKNSRGFIEDNTLCQQEIRDKNAYVQSMQELFPTLNTKLTNNLLYLSLESICKQLEIKITNSMILDYIFHGNCLLNRLLTSHSHFQLEGEEDKDVYKIIENSLHTFSQLHKIQFQPGDIEILYQSLFSQLGKK